MAPYIILLGGGTGSGKTGWSRGLVERVPGLLCIGMDRYYRDLGDLPHGERGQRNFDAPESFDLALLCEQVAALRAGRAVELPVYDFRTHTRAHPTEHAEPPPALLVEGILALAVPGLLSLADLRLYLSVPEEIAFERRLARDVQERGRTRESVHEQYAKTVRPMHEAHVWPSGRHADLWITGGQENGASLDVIAAAVRFALHPAVAIQEESNGD